MGKQFGNLQKLKGINYYYLSPYEQNPFKGFFTVEMMHVLRRIRENFLIFGTPIVLLYVARDQLLKKHKQMHRKNPDDYKDDE